MHVFGLCLVVFLLQRTANAVDVSPNFDWKTIKFGQSESAHDEILSPPSEHNQKLFYRIKSMVTRRRSRSIADAVIETVRCEHIELMDCDAYDTDEMTCMITATGMPCCICSGKLKSLKTNKKLWSLW
ncbi:hypothetical protein M3Y95_00505900 [Aphelenchoides besseyi]|nr:hypothetical protein M3Y95_00505900 [Aphelenchoides besseyi]